MRKLIKATLGIVGAGICILVSVGSVGWWKLKRTPTWYQPRTLAAADRAEAAEHAERKLIQTQNWAADTEARKRTSLRHSSTTSPTTLARLTPLPIDSFVIAFTERELNAFFEKWSVTYRWAERYERYVTDPVIIVGGGRLILAGRMKDRDTVLSFHFHPRLDQNQQLKLELVRVQGGELPLPEAVWNTQREMLVEEIGSRLPDWQKRAKLSPSGGANRQTITATMGRLVMDILHDRSAEPVLYLPIVDGDAVPVRISRLEIDGNELLLQVEPLTDGERAELLERIRTPYGSVQPEK